MFPQVLYHPELGYRAAKNETARAALGDGWRETALAFLPDEDNPLSRLELRIAELRGGVNQASLSVRL